MKAKTKIIILFLTVLILIKTEVYPQNDVDSLSHTRIYISAGLGYKYHFTKIEPYPYSFEEAYKNHYAFIFNIAADFWGGQKHIIGLELLGYPYKYGDGSMSPKYFTLISNFFYRRNIHLSNNITLFPAGGLSFFSNDPVHMLTVYLDIGISYDLGNYEVFLKNSFRFAMPFLFDNAPWILSAGCSIKI